MRGISAQIEHYSYKVGISGCNLTLVGTMGEISSSEFGHGSYSGTNKAGLELNLRVLADENRKRGYPPLISWTQHKFNDRVPMMSVGLIGCTSCVEHAAHFSSQTSSVKGRLKCTDSTSQPLNSKRVCSEYELNHFLLQTPINDLLIRAEIEEGKRLLTGIQNAFHYLLELESKRCEPNIQKGDPLDKYFQRGHISSTETTPRQQSQLTTANNQVNLIDPETWRGKTITGQRTKSGKKWYSYLATDGTTTFRTSSGKTLFGRYRISNGSVCYTYDDTAGEACRTPLHVSGRVRWYNETGGYVSFIDSVDEYGFPNPKSKIRVKPEILKHIPPGKCALIVASRSTVEEVRDYVRINISDRRYLKTFKSKNGTIGISIGTLKPNEVKRTLDRLKAKNQIPSDSYCADGSNYSHVVNLGSL